MTKEQAEFIEKAYDYMGEEIDVRSDYSGRGMFGKSTYGIVIQNPADMLCIVMQYIKEELIGGGEDLYDIIPDFGRFKLDNMGLRTIAY